MSEVQRLNDQINAIAAEALRANILSCLDELTSVLDNTAGGTMGAITGNLKTVINAYKQQARAVLDSVDARARQAAQEDASEPA